MITYFDNPKDFIASRGVCVFCANNLRPIVSNFTMMSGGIPSVTSKYNGRAFKFHMNYNSAYANVDCDVSIDCNNSVVKFKMPRREYLKACSAFDSLKLHIELCCPNKACKLKYYVSSDPLEIAMFQVFNQNVVRIKATKLYMECFKLGGLMIQNDFQNSKTNIFSISKPDASPIQMAIMDFGSMAKEKLFNKIHTYVNFS